MGKTTQSVSGYDLFLLLGQISHFTQLVRRRELTQHHIAPQQLYVLRIIQEMGVNATLSEVAKHATYRYIDTHVERHVFFRQKDTQHGQKIRFFSPSPFPI